MNIDLFESEVSEAPRLKAWEPAQWAVDASWQPLVSGFFEQRQGQQLGGAIAKRLVQGAVIYPPEPLWALALTPLERVKVVILGQDPYHGPHQAQGLAFSVGSGVKIPPSLRNIFKEIARDDALKAPQTSRASAPANGALQRWARQGVLLLNSCLTVEKGQPASHAKLGWEVLTDKIIQAVWVLKQPVVFLLWGAHAQSKRVFMTAGAPGSDSHGPHLVLTANHPSPLSALRPPQPFVGCGHFSKANQHLQAHGRSPIQW